MTRFILSLFFLLATAPLSRAGSDNWKMTAEIERAMSKNMIPC